MCTVISNYRAFETALCSCLLVTGYAVRGSTSTLLHRYL
jgi:hypothetical protein